MSWCICGLHGPTDHALTKEAHCGLVTMDSHEKVLTIQFLRHHAEHLEDKAKADLKIALYGSALAFVISFIPYGDLPHTTLLISAIDLWYFMSWGDDQLRLMQYRDHLRELEDEGGVERRSEAHRNFRFERTLYFMTPFTIVAMFIVGLILDYRNFQVPMWREIYFSVVGLATIAVLFTFCFGFAHHGHR